MSDSKAKETQEIRETAPDSEWFRPFPQDEEKNESGKSAVKSMRLKDGSVIHLVVQEFKVPENVSQVLPSRLFTFQFDNKGSEYFVFARLSSKPEAVYRTHVQTEDDPPVYTTWKVLEQKSQNEGPFNVPLGQTKDLEIMIVNNNAQRTIGERISWK